MNRYFLIIVLLLLGTIFFSQEKASAQKAWVGLHFGNHLFAVTDNNTEWIESDTEIQYKSQKIAGGQGVNYGAVIGTMVNDYIGFDLQLIYFNGKEGQYLIEYPNHYTVDDVEYDIVVRLRYTRNCNMFRMVPSLVIKAPGELFVKPSMRVGAILGIPKQLYEYEDYDDDDRDGAIDEDYMEIEYKGNFAFGFYSALGFEISLTQNVAVSVELAGNVISWSPKSSEIVTWTVDGRDVIGEKTTYDLKREYVKKYTYDPDQVDESSPSKNTKISIPFSNIEGNIGLIYRF